MNYNLKNMRVITAKLIGKILLYFVIFASVFIVFLSVGMPLFLAFGLAFMMIAWNGSVKDLFN